jgi:hypothetical protein
MPWNLKETPDIESFLLDRCYHGVHYDIVYLEPMKYWCDTSQVTLSTTQTGMSTFYDVLCTSKTGTLSNTIAFSERVARDGDRFVAPFLICCPGSASQVDIKELKNKSKAQGKDRAA